MALLKEFEIETIDCKSKKSEGLWSCELWEKNSKWLENIIEKKYTPNFEIDGVRDLVMSNSNYNFGSSSGEMAYHHIGYDNKVKCRLVSSSDNTIKTLICNFKTFY